MKKFIITVVVLNSLIWLGLSNLMSAAKADEYKKAVVGHVIQSTVNGTNVDVGKLMEQELEKVAHQFPLESIIILQKYLPTILDGIATDMRLQADKRYKCELLKGSKIEDDCK